MDVAALRRGIREMERRAGEGPAAAEELQRLLALTKHEAAARPEAAAVLAEAAAAEAAAVEAAAKAAAAKAAAVAAAKAAEAAASAATTVPGEAGGAPAAKRPKVAALG